MSKRLLVAGCGFLGRAVADRWLALGHEVIGVTHSAESARALQESAPFQVESCDLANLADVTALAGRIPPPELMIHCASSGRQGVEQYQRVYFDGVVNLNRAIPALLLFTSSTSVYAQMRGEEITEDSPADPIRETGRILKRAEDETLSWGGIVARLAGLYGPGRSVILQRFLDGSAIIETGTSRFLNQIHRDDAASALATLLDHADTAEGIYNVSDSHPLTQRECYEQLAAHFQRPVPPEGAPDPNRKRGWTHKRLSNAKMRGLGWNPRYASFMDAVREDPALVPSIQKLIGESRAS